MPLWGLGRTLSGTFLPGINDNYHMAVAAVATTTTTATTGVVAAAVAATWQMKNWTDTAKLCAGSFMPLYFELATRDCWQHLIWRSIMAVITWILSPSLSGNLNLAIQTAWSCTCDLAHRPLCSCLPFLNLQAVDLDESMKAWFCWGPRRISSTEFCLGSLQLLLQGLWSLLAPGIWSPRKHHILAWLECVNAVCISGNILPLGWAWTSCTVMGYTAL